LLEAAAAKPTAAWPRAFITLPAAVTEEKSKGLTISEVARLAAARPGDRALWEALAARCHRTGLPTGGQMVHEVVGAAGWPAPAPIRPPAAWDMVDVGDLPAPLIAVIRHGGAIPAKAAPEGDADRKAVEAYFRESPDLPAAEVYARKACSEPSATSLNLLAAIRLADPGASQNALLQALAFATQATALDPAHAYSRVNVARSLQRMGWRAEVRAAIAAIPAASPGTWQALELEKISEWLGSQ
jgi:hypothetical protein